jgi:hypothetical protein
MFNRVLATWKNLVSWGRQQPGSTGERRVWIRYPCQLDTTSQAAQDPEAPPLFVRVRNISRGGISLAVEREFEPGELLSIELPTSPGTPASTVLACVVRSQAQADGTWILGCTFAAQLQDQDLQLFGAVRVKPDDPDQRAWVRFECKAQAFCRAVNVPDSILAPATILNVSASGVALQTSEPLAIGELITIDLRAGEHFLFSTLACVVRVTTPADGGLPILGCNFIGELTDAQLQSLLR